VRFVKALASAKVQMFTIVNDFLGHADGRIELRLVKSAAESRLLTSALSQ